MPSCFVVMGYGVKTDPNQNKSFDLDKSYKYIIKPAAEAAGFTCQRADEIQHAGVIDVPMYERLLAADLVIADLSTANVNAFFELGVRYALRPFATIIMAENGFVMPFDIGHVAMRRYKHLGEGIDFGEVENKKKELADLCREIGSQKSVDSPVYVFINDLEMPRRRAAADGARAFAPVATRAETEREERTQEALGKAETTSEKTALTQPLAALMELALAARSREDFKTMRNILGGVCAVQGKNPDTFVVQQLALATYKAADPDAQSALEAAGQVLKALDPESSGDPETLGLWGAIHKRLWGLKQRPKPDRLASLDRAIWAYEKGFYLKNDYYNGINFAFLLNVRAAETAGDDAVADRVQARRIRERVVSICRNLLAASIKLETEAKSKAEEYWVRATLAEALMGSGHQSEGDQEFDKAKAMKPEPWMIKTSTDQQTELMALLQPR